MSGAKAVQVGEFRENLAGFLKEVAGGQELLVLSRGKPLARLLPPAAPTAVEGRRPVGLMKGRIWMAPDWDEPDPDMIAAIESLDDLV